MDSSFDFEATLLDEDDFCQFEMIIFVGGLSSDQVRWIVVSSNLFTNLIRRLTSIVLGMEQG